MSLQDLICNEVHDHSSFHPPGFDPYESLQMLLQHEARTSGGTTNINGKYLDEIQSHGMEASWRKKICHWMFETGKAFELTQDTVACAIHFMDQYLSLLSVDKIMLQLLSMVCMYIASKMHESQPISMEEMDLLSQHKFTREDIRKVEAQVLQVLEWKLNPPTSFTFARDLLDLLNVAEKEEMLEPVMDFLQQVHEEYAFVGFKSSSIAIAAIQVVWNAKCMPPCNVLSKELDYLGFQPQEVRACHTQVIELYRQHHPEACLLTVEIEESKSEPSRSCSPTSVDEAMRVFRILPPPNPMDYIPANKILMMPIVTSTIVTKKSLPKPLESNVATGSKRMRYI
jgi:hypothetical protein